MESSSSFLEAALSTGLLLLMLLGFFEDAFLLEFWEVEKKNLLNNAPPLEQCKHPGLQVLLIEKEDGRGESLQGCLVNPAIAALRDIPFHRREPKGSNFVHFSGVCEPFF